MLSVKLKFKKKASKNAVSFFSLTWLEVSVLLTASTILKTDSKRAPKSTNLSSVSKNVCVP